MLRYSCYLGKPEKVVKKLRNKVIAYKIIEKVTKTELPHGSSNKHSTFLLCFIQQLQDHITCIVLTGKFVSSCNSKDFLVPLLYISCFSLERRCTIISDAHLSSMSTLGL